MSEGNDKEKLPREREESLCPCKSQLPYKSCCMPFHHGKAKPKTAEQLMRSRYSAYFFRKADYLYDTTHPDTRDASLRKQLKKTIHAANWKFLTVLRAVKGGPDDKVGKVEFIADYYIDGEACQLHEVSRFKRYKGQWKYLDGKS